MKMNQIPGELWAFLDEKRPQLAQALRQAGVTVCSAMEEHPRVRIAFDGVTQRALPADARAWCDHPSVMRGLSRLPPDAVLMVLDGTAADYGFKAPHEN